MATVDDVIYICRGLFSGRADIAQVREVSSILLGAGLIKPHGDAGGFSAEPIERINCTTRDGYKEERNSIKVEVMSLLGDSGALLLGDAAYVA